VTLDRSSTGAALTATVQPALDGTIRVDVAGCVDLSTADILTRALTKALDERPMAVVVNLKDLTFMDSTGVNALMNAHRRARAESAVVTVVNSPPVVVHILRVLGIYELFNGGA
jgi:anti-sigma B factor antagonist